MGRLRPQAYLKYMLFAGSTGISLLTNLLIIRNLAPNQLRYWILAVTVTAFVSVVLQATQFRVELKASVKIADQKNENSLHAQLRTSIWSFFTIFALLTLLSLFVSEDLFFACMYSLLMVPFIFLNFFVQGSLQNASRQLTGMTLSLAISTALITLIGVSIQFGLLTLSLLLISNLLITSVCTLFAIQKFTLRSDLRWLDFSDLKHIAFYSIFWILCMVDIPIVSFFSTEIDQGLYSAASTYGKFAFICSQFLLFFKLPEIKQASRLSEILKYAISIALLSLIPMLAMSITPSGF